MGLFHRVSVSVDLKIFLTRSEQHKVSLSMRRAVDHSLNSGDRDLDI